MPNTSNVINPRKVAVDCFAKILKGRFVDDCINSDERVAGLEQRDKNFINALLLTTLRHYGEIDHFLHQFAKRKTPELYLAIAQLKFMDIAPHAVTNEMVEVSERKAFTNAILRNAIQKDIHQNIKLNFPKWMKGSWKKAYGADAADKFMEVMITEPNYVDFTHKGGESKRIEDAGSIVDIEGFAEGDWWVQDGSQVNAVRIMGDIKGKKVLDMCAAPGGKTAQLIDGGAEVTALDSSEKRISRLEENLKRLKMECEIIHADARSFNKGEYDIILIDAPCSATGTIRRHPEILQHQSLESIKELVAMQNDLLGSAYKLLKADGFVVYSTCSLQYEECEGLVKKLEHYELVEEKRTLPTDHENGIGGAYAAKLKKI